MKGYSPNLVMFWKQCDELHMTEACTKDLPSNDKLSKSWASSDFLKWRWTTRFSCHLGNYDCVSLTLSCPLNCTFIMIITTITLTHLWPEWQCPLTAVNSEKDFSQMEKIQDSFYFSHDWMSQLDVWREKTQKTQKLKNAQEQTPT